MVLSFNMVSIRFSYHNITTFQYIYYNKTIHFTMNERKSLDYFESEFYNNVGDYMKNFMTHNFIIGEITFANIVKAGTGAKVHKNRKSHGLAFFPGGERTFYFEHKKIKIEGNTIVYFPKGSNYTIKEKISFDCYAINFEMPDNACFEPFSFKVKNVNAYLESFKQAQRQQMRKTTGYDSKIKSELYNIIYNMQSEYNLPYTNSKIIEPAPYFNPSRTNQSNITKDRQSKTLSVFLYVSFSI